jgi:hypothetical protein
MTMPRLDAIERSTVDVEAEGFGRMPNSVQ